MDKVRRHFQPEFLNRNDEFIIFDPLSTDIACSSALLLTTNHVLCVSCRRCVLTLSALLLPSNQQPTLDQPHSLFVCVAADVCELVMDKVRRHSSPSSFTACYPTTNRMFCVSFAADVRELVMDKVRRHFQPESLNRISTNPVLH
jgi:hypothetical protein